MKIKTIVTTTSLASLAVFLFPPLAAHADGAHDHAHENGHEHEHTHEHEHNEEIVIPDTLGGLWQAIQKEGSVLAEAVEKRNEEAVHIAEEKLQAYLEALPGKTGELDERTRGRVAGQAANLARVYDAVHTALHEGTDDGAWEKASAEVKKAEGGLKLLGAQLPGEQE